MTVDQAIRKRRSVRQYKDLEVSAALIEEILDLARHAPSSMNGQPWRFVVVRDPTVKRRIADTKNRHCPTEKVDFPADFLVAAPVLVAVCVERDRSHHRGKENGILASAALMLAATARGLGSVYLSAYRDTDPALQEEIARILELPRDIEPIALLPLGFAADSPDDKPMRPLAEMIRHV